MMQDLLFTDYVKNCISPPLCRAERGPGGEVSWLPFTDTDKEPSNA